MERDEAIELVAADHVDKLIEQARSRLADLCTAGEAFQHIQVVPNRAVYDFGDDWLGNPVHVGVIG